MSVPLRVFEDRYRALVHHLLRVDDPTERVFGSVGIREGYEVGEHGAQWLFRIGCRVKMTEVEALPDGTFELVARRARPDRAGAPRHHRRLPGRARDARSGARRVAVPEQVDEPPGATYDAYRDALLEIDREPPSGELPHDPAYLSWALAALAPLSLSSGRRCSRPRTPPAGCGW